MLPQGGGSPIDQAGDQARGASKCIGQAKCITMLQFHNFTATGASERHPQKITVNPPGSPKNIT